MRSAGGANVVESLEGVVAQMRSAGGANVVELLEGVVKMTEG